MNRLYTRITIFVFVSFTTLTSFKLVGQAINTEPEKPSKLSLMDAIFAGLENNYQLQVAVLQRTQSENVNTWGMAGALPSISAISTGRYSKSENNNPFNFITAVTQDNTYESQSFGQSVDLGWTLFKGFRVHAQKQKFDLLEEQSLGFEQVVMENTIQAIMLAYYRTKVESKKEEVSKIILELSSERFRKAEQKKALGASSSFQLLQEKSAYLTDSTNLLSQRLLKRNSLRNLNLVMGVNEDKQWELVDDLVLNDQVLVYDSLKNQLMSSNRHLQNQYVNLEILKKEIKLQQSMLYPTINFGTGVNYGDQRFSNSQSSGGGTSIDFYGNASLSFNLFNGGQVRKAIASARIQERIGQIEFSEQKHQLQNSLQQNWDFFVARKDLYLISKENEETARLNVSMAKEREVLGAISSFNYRQIQMAYLNASIATQEYLYQCVESKIELMRLSGQIIQNK